MLQGIKDVLFDFDGTLVFHQPDSFDLISAYCTDIGQPLSKDAEWRGHRVRHQYFVDPEIRNQLQGLSRDEFWRHFNRHLLSAIGVEGDLEELAGGVTSRFQDAEFAYSCPEDGCETLRELRARGYRIGLLTNRNNVERFYELLDEMKLRTYFDMTLASGETGYRKPEPAIFYAALDHMDARAELSIYVGDNYWADVVGAERAGITPVLFDPRHLFPEATCQVVERISDLLDWLPGPQATKA